MQAVATAQQSAETALNGFVMKIEQAIRSIAQKASAAVSAAQSPSGTVPGRGGSSGGSGTTSTGSNGSASGAAARQSTAGGSASGASASGGSASGSAGRIASDEVSILQDQASVTEAQANLSGATLRSPIAGTVGQVNLTAGQAASSSGIVIIGVGAAEVTVDIPLADMTLVHAGLAAAVSPAGDVASVPGTVSAVNLLPVSATATTPTYPATLVVPEPPRSMATGSVVSVAITVSRADGAVRLPVSAISGLQAGTGEVQVLGTSAPKTQAITVGAVGGGYAQVLTGLAPGDRVILADPSAPLPTNQFAGLRGLGGGGFGAARVRTGG